MLLAILLQLTSPSPAALASNDQLASDSHAELINRYVEATQNGASPNCGLEQELTIDASIPRLHRKATLRTLRTTSLSGAVAYTVLDAQGDSLVKREVIARYLAADREAGNTAGLAITPRNYRFQFKGIVEGRTQRIYVFRLKPRQRKPGLFAGELWLDGQTGLPIRELGRFAKSPSLFIRRISFTRDYGTRNGNAVPVHIHSVIESRIAGRVELDIHFEAANAPTAKEVIHHAK